jgi:hypothetical protein
MRFIVSSMSASAGRAARALRTIAAFLPSGAKRRSR